MKGFSYSKKFTRNRGLTDALQNDGLRIDAIRINGRWIDGLRTDGLRIDQLYIYGLQTLWILKSPCFVLG